MKPLAPEGAEFVGTVKGSQETVFYKGVIPGVYSFSYSGESWVTQPGKPMRIPLIPIAEWLAKAEQQRTLMVVQAIHDIAESVRPYNLNIECSVAMKEVVEAMIDAGYRK